MRSPWAILTSRITPKISDSPAANIAYSPPTSTPCTMTLIHSISGAVTWRLNQVGRVGEFHVSEMSRGGGRERKCPPPLTPPRHALRAWAGGEIRCVRNACHSHPEIGRRDRLARQIYRRVGERDPPLLQSGERLHH